MANQIKAPINYPIIAGGKIVSGGSVIFGQPNVKPDPDNPSTLKAVYLDAALTQQAENPQGISSDGVFDQSDTGILYGPSDTLYSIVILGANKKQLSYIPEYDLSDANAAAAAQDSAAQAESAASNAIAAKDLTEALYTDFTNRYFGAFSSDPSVDDLGNPPSEGSIYFNTVSDVFFTWNGSAWVNYFPSNPNGLMVTATGTTTPRSLADRFADSAYINDFSGAVLDGVNDDTPALTEALASNKKELNLRPTDILTISSVDITNDITINGNGATIKRLDMSEVNSSITANGAGMFQVEQDGLNITFNNVVFDGNNINQPITRTNPTAPNANPNPYSALFRYIPSDPDSATDCRFNFNGCSFKRGSWKYLYIAGDTSERRFRTVVHMSNPIFTDSILGYGANDPRSPNPLGLAPDYVIVMDYVEFSATNFDARFDTDSSAAGDYAPSAIRGTYRGTSATAGEVSVRLYGTTKLRSLGRKFSVYNDLNTYGNNAIGVIDIYGNGDTLYVENVEAYDSQFVTVRAKGSLDYFTVRKGYMKDCVRGVQVSPSSTGAPVTKVRITDITHDGGQAPAVSCLGNSGVLTLPSVSIDGVYSINGTNTEGLGVTELGDVYCRYVSKVSISSIETENSPQNGILVRDCGDVSISNINTTLSGGYGVYSLDCTGNFTLSGGNIDTSALNGANISSNNGIIKVRDICVDGADNYGIFANSSSTYIDMSGCSVKNITGSQRGYYYASNGVSANNTTDNTVVIELFKASGVTVSQNGDSWRGRDFYGSTVPTTGTYAVGDRLWRTSPVASGIPCWVCVTAGTPGTWVAMADLQA